MAEKIDLVGEAEKRILGFVNDMAAEFKIQEQDARKFVDLLPKILVKNGLRLTLYQDVRS